MINVWIFPNMIKARQTKNRYNKNDIYLQVWKINQGTLYDYRYHIVVLQYQTLSVDRSISDQLEQYSKEYIFLSQDSSIQIQTIIFLEVKS